MVFLHKEEGFGIHPFQPDPFGFFDSVEQWIRNRAVLSQLEEVRQRLWMHLHKVVTLKFAVGAACAETFFCIEPSCVMA